MKRIITFLTILISISAIAQNSTEKTIGEFSKLKVYDLINVELIKATENKIIVSGNNQENVLIHNLNGTLKIKMKLKKAYNGNETLVTLYYKNIENIDVNEGAKVNTNDKIKQFEIQLSAQEGGVIKVPLNVTFTKIKAVSGGIIETTGKSQIQNISLSTGGVYKAKDLKTEKTEVTIKAAGEAHITASKLVDIKIRAGGDVFIYGKPEKVNESKVLGGRVKYVD